MARFESIITLVDIAVIHQQSHYKSSYGPWSNQQKPQL